MKKDRGISFVEVLVVMSILAILSAISIPNFMNYLKKTKVRVAKVTLASIRTAMEMYKNKNDTYPKTGGVTSLTSLYNTLSPYLPPKNPNDPFPAEFLKDSPVVYQGTTFSYTLQVTSRANTPVTATPAILSGVFEGEEIPIPY